MFVIKRDGRKETVKFDKITNRIEKLLEGIDNIDAVLITQKICNRIYPGITTTELDILASEVCMSMVTENPNFGILGSRLAISNHQKNTKENFLDVVTDLTNNTQILSDELVEITKKYETEINNIINYERDYLLDYFGFKTLEKSYLLKINKKPVERPQHLFMRVAIGIHGEDLENVKKTYDNISLKNYTHATPTLFNAGTKFPQLSSCYLSATEDSIEGIFETITDCAKISKWAGGIGLHISNIRGNGSYIRKTGGYSDGIMPMLKVYNDVARYVNQGGGKRNGSFAMYLEPWHTDVFQFLDAKKNHGAEEERARDLFYAMWVPDLFMEMVEKNEDWYLMCPDKCPGLPDVYGEEFNKLYLKYIEEGRYNKKIKARELWEAIISSQVETGVPYIGYKDHVNRKNNQNNIDTIRSSNLCVVGETMILTSKGYFPIKDLENKEVEVWNGKEWSETIVKKTGENQKVISVFLSNGIELKCTPYHKFYIETGSRPADKSRPVLIDAKDLKSNMKIIRYETTILKDNHIDMKYPYMHGFFCADGTYSVNDKEEIRCSYKKIDNSDFCGRHQTNIKKFFDDNNICSALCYTSRPMISLYGEKIKLLKYFDYNSVGEYDTMQDKITISLPYDINNKFYVPINNSINTKIRWLEGYLDGDGCIIENDGLKNIQFVSIHKNFLRNILYLLQTLGIISQIKLAKEEGETLLPDGKGGNKLYNTKKSYRMSIDSTGLDKLIKLGFSPKRLDISNTRLPHHKTNMFIKVENIEDNNECEDTFCFNEPKEHKGIFNGILTGQCIEINEVSNKDETAVCNLASICLPSMLENPVIESFIPNVRWIKLLNTEEKVLYNYFYEGKLKLYSKEDCDYCKLLKSLLDKSGLYYDEINKEDAEKYRIISEPNMLNMKPFETVPQLFSFYKDKIYHLGGYDNCWKILKPRINYNKLYNMSYELTINLNKIIDKNFYPIEKTRTSNLRHRPIGIGVQGLADLFIKLKLPFDSSEAMKINKEIFETIYYGAITSSVDIAEKEDSYSSFEGSPLSKGEFQFNLWGLKDEDLSGRYDWNSLRDKVVKNGVRNSLLIALMPTASTSQILGSNECFEPITSNIYNRRTLAGEFTVINKYLVEDLLTLDLWNQDTKDRLIYDKGSVKNIKGLPTFIKDIYKTVWEISQKNIIQMSADRGPFVCQSQSLNLFFEKPTFKILHSAHFTGWKLGLKTGSYYIRSKPATGSQRFGFDPIKEKELKKEDEECLNCSA